MNLNSILIGSEDPKPLVEYYTKLFGDPAGSEGGYTWWQVGTGGFTVSEHSEVKGKNAHPGRVIWNIETDDVKGDFERLKAAGATVIQAPYAPDVGDAPEAPEMSVATSSARCSGGPSSTNGPIPFPISGSFEMSDAVYRLSRLATTLIVIATTTVPKM